MPMSIPSAVQKTGLIFSYYIFCIFRLLYAIDYDGRICGIDSGVGGRPNAYYMSSSAVVCISSCPSKVDYTRFICYDEYQLEADASTLRAWELVGMQYCLFQVETVECENCAL